MANVLSVFVSSSCFELRDMRAAVRDLLRSLEINPQLSEDPGFPRFSGDRPHVTCLRTLADCPLVIGLLEQRSGTSFADWSPFPEYNGLSAVHAELRHAVKLRKKLLLYIHADTLSTYRHWKANPQAANQMAEVSMLSLVDELLTQDPAAYYESFTDASDVLASLKRLAEGSGSPKPGSGRIPHGKDSHCGTGNTSTNSRAIESRSVGPTTKAHK
jgi:hypothetical protein